LTFLAFFKTILIDACCLGCGRIRYLPEKDYQQKFEDYFSKNDKISDIILPVQNHLTAYAFFNLPYATLMEVDKIFYIGVKSSQWKATDKMSSLFRSLLGTWPLLVMALSMATGAGSVIWVLVSDIVLCFLYA
jgi:hypothetical protein